MRRIYFIPDDVTDLRIPDLTLSLDLWESSYDLIMSEPVGKNFHKLWRHHFGAEAEMRLSGPDLRKLEAGIKKLLKNDLVSAELNTFLSHLTVASVNARAKQYDMIVIAE